MADDLVDRHRIEIGARRAKQVDDRRQRIGTRDRREAEHRQHDDDADERGHGRACPYVHEVHILEHCTQARRHRHRPLGLQAADDGPLEAGNLIEAVLNHPNLAAPNGNLSSLLFGRSTSLLGGQGMSGNRRIDLQVKFSF